MSGINVLIIDDHPLFREGLKLSLGRSPRFVVAGEAENGREGLELAHTLNPDVVIVDIGLPGLNGIQVVARLRKELPKVKTLVLSGFVKTDYVLDAFEAGALGYMTKDTVAANLLNGLETILRGEVFIDCALSRDVLEQLMLTRRKRTLSSHGSLDDLTSREQEILLFMVSGRSKEELAQELHISVKTVENHRSRILGKLGIKNDVDLIRFAARSGLIDLDAWVRQN